MGWILVDMLGDRASVGCKVFRVFAKGLGGGFDMTLGLGAWMGESLSALSKGSIWGSLSAVLMGIRVGGL